MGPEGGEAGGYLVATGTPEQVAADENSHTGRVPARAGGAGGRAGGARTGRQPAPAGAGRGLSGRAAHHSGMSDRGQLADLRLWAQKWRWYERNSLPWNRFRIHHEMARRRAFVRWPVHGNVLEALREGRLTVGAGTLLEPGVWLTAPGAARLTIGEGCFLNLGVMVAAMELVEIGSHCMFANGCFVTDANHRFDDPDQPVTWQGFSSRGPARIGDNVWCGANWSSPAA